jgi:hypothetical protein
VWLKGCVYLKKDTDKFAKPGFVDSLKNNNISPAFSGWVRLYDLLTMCDDGWFIELYDTRVAPHYYSCIESREECFECGYTDFNNMVFFDGFDTSDKIIYAYCQCPDEYNKQLNIPTAPSR